MNGKELDKILRAFEKAHPFKRVCKRKIPLNSFVDSIEKQLDKLPN